MTISFQERSIEEQEAASIVASLHSTSNISSGNHKRPRRNSNVKNVDADADDVDGNAKRAKKPAALSAARPRKDPPMDATGLVFAQPELKPAPYFYYTDHSHEMDDDPLTPITAAGSVPTFPAKMHAILANPDLADVVEWAPHGRSWRIIKPRDFEIRILSIYFEHSKFSSFVRQANGWGFRRVGQGFDKNAYYHEYFLRGMPWLCKKMRRPKVAEKKALDPKLEPDLDAISLEFPVIDRPPTREVLVLQQTIAQGPKARMPVHWGTDLPPEAPSSAAGRAPEEAPPPPVEDDEDLKPAALPESLPSLNRRPSFDDVKRAARPDNPPQAPAVPPAPHNEFAVPAVATNNQAMDDMNIDQNHQVQQHLESNFPRSAATMPVSAANQNNAAFIYTYVAPNRLSHVEEPSQTSTDSQFAAGFLAATAFHSERLHSVLSDAFAAGVPLSDSAGNMVMPSLPTPAAARVAVGQALASASAHRGNLENTLDLMQRARMLDRLHRQQQLGIRAPDNLHLVSRGNGLLQPQSVRAAFAAGIHQRLNGSMDATNHSPSFSEEAMHRLRRLQVFQAAMGEAPQFPFSSHRF